MISERGPARHRGRPLVLSLAFLLLLGFSRESRPGDLQVTGFGWLRGIDADGPPSWLEGGFGRFTEGGTASGGWATAARLQGQAALDWRPSPLWRVHVHGLARYEGSSARGQRAGVTEAFAEFQPELSPSARLRFTVGTFFPHTSRENVGPLWSSPYTLTLSALNTWVGEEMRLTGLESALIVTSGRDEFQIAGTAFGANDPLGALVAWRGFTLGDRLVTIGETLPLPPLPSFRVGAAFGRQLPDGTRPIDELDDRVGWQARGRWQRSDAALLQFAYLDNQGDLALHDGQYAWHTRMSQVGGELRLAPRLRLIGEGAVGETKMGDFRAFHVDVAYRVGYLLLTWGGPTLRGSVRYDRFRNLDRAGTVEPEGDSGRAWTAAILWNLGNHVRLGAELADLRAERPAAAYAGASPNTGGRKATSEVRLRF